MEKMRELGTKADRQSAKMDQQLTALRAKTDQQLIAISATANQQKEQLAVLSAKAEWQCKDLDALECQDGAALLCFDCPD